MSHAVRIGVRLFGLSIHINIVSRNCIDACFILPEGVLLISSQRASKLDERSSGYIVGFSRANFLANNLQCIAFFWSASECTCRWRQHFSLDVCISMFLFIAIFSFESKAALALSPISFAHFMDQVRFVNNAWYVLSLCDVSSNFSRTVFSALSISIDREYCF